MSTSVTTQVAIVLELEAWAIQIGYKIRYELKPCCYYLKGDVACNLYPWEICHTPYLTSTLGSKHGL